MARQAHIFLTILVVLPTAKLQQQRKFLSMFLSGAALLTKL
jgi:hypothetical protein